MCRTSACIFVFRLAFCLGASAQETSIAVKMAPCINGTAGGFACHKIDLLVRLTLDDLFALQPEQASQRHLGLNRPR